ncbi:zf-TFIIB domain-containing protein [bacterium]|nr:zf-TFIIB domain-containing protein [bacterium]
MADTTRKIECPACGCEMQKIYIDDAEVCVDICTEGCGGIYFDNREFNKFDEANENVDAILGELEGKEFKEVDQREVRICPVCNVPMVKAGSGVKGVEIDVCYTCGAKFLDNGELEKIREGKQENLEQLNQLIDEMYKRDVQDAVGGQVKRPVTKNLRVAVEKIVYRGLKHLH